MYILKPTYWTKVENDPNDHYHKTYIYTKGDIPATRYVILFNTFDTARRLSYSISYYDNYDECLEECNELDEMYKDHSLPIVEKELSDTSDRYGRKIQKVINKFDFSNNRSWWGYIVLDFEKSLIKKVGGNGLFLKNKPNINKLKGANAPENLDYFFRNVDEVPDDYKWDGEEEYQGWLQFKWGNGKNAIGYVEQSKSKRSTDDYDEPLDFSMPEDYENATIEKKFSDLIDKETHKRLMDRYR